MLICCLDSIFGCRRRSRELKERKEEPPLAEPEADPERDQRTVFAYQVNTVNTLLSLLLNNTCNLSPAQCLHCEP